MPFQVYAPWVPIGIYGYICMTCEFVKWYKSKIIKHRLLIGSVHFINPESQLGNRQFSATHQRPEGRKRPAINLSASLLLDAIGFSDLQNQRIPRPTQIEISIQCLWALFGLASGMVGKLDTYIYMLLEDISYMLTSKHTSEHSACDIMWWCHSITS